MKRVLAIALAAALLCGVLLMLSACDVSVDDTMLFAGMRWLVLDEQDGYALLLSEEIIAIDVYHGEFENSTWEHSDIRHWLNQELYYRFSEQDRARIRQTHVTNNDNPWFGTPGGNNTVDNIFLLSLEEVEQYFGNNGLRYGPPEPGVERRYTRDRPIEVQIAYFIDRAESWWLRSPGVNESAAALVLNTGCLSVSGNSFPAEIGIRPALWLYL